MTVDIRVHGGTVHQPGGAVRADLLITGEKISGLVSPDDATVAKQRIDATGKFVMPGIVDLHAHTRTPGYEYKEDFTTASQAAAAGGITTFVDMPNLEPPTESVATFEAARKIAEKSCLIDWGHFASPSKLTEIPALAKAGVTGYKMFQVSGGYPHDPRLAMGDPDKIYEAFDAVAKTGLPCVVHPFNMPLFMKLSEVAWAAGKPRDIVTFSEVYTTNVVWSSAVAILLELQRLTAVRLHLVHTHSSWSLRLIRHAKAEGARVTSAIDPKYFHLTHKDLTEQKARAIPGGFVTEDAERLAEIWRSVNDGTIDIIDSDHAPHTLKDLERMEADPWTGPFGAPHYDHELALFLTDVHDGRLSLARLVQLFCETPATILGIYPRKGALRVGSDADLVVVDLNKETMADDQQMYSKVKWTPYRGRRFIGAPVLTILRGSVIAKDGVVTGRPGSGRYIAGVSQQ
jgi:dihydroorotase (multifunctional complex type)